MKSSSCAVWGWAEPGESVRVGFRGEEREIVTDVMERELVEGELDHLSGYDGARPVRIGNGVWLGNTAAGFTTPDSAADYGTWTWNLTTTALGSGNNWSTAYAASDAAAAPPPTAQPEAGAS